MFNKKLQIMKKLLCILWVAMLTMLATTFAQPVVMPVYSYFIVTNKTTNETKSISVNEFTSTGSSSSECNVDFCFGVYDGDQIEITYSPAFSSAKPKLAWSSSNGNLSPETGLTTKLTVERIFSDGTTLTVTCDYKADEMSSYTNVYKINFKNVQTRKRITVSQLTDSEIYIAYANYYEDDVYSCSGKLPTTVLYDSEGNVLSTGYLNGRGIGTLATKGYKGIGIMKVLVNNVEIYAGKITIR